MRFFGFPFEWDTAYNNLPCTDVQSVINHTKYYFYRYIQFINAGKATAKSLCLVLQAFSVSMSSFSVCLLSVSAIRRSAL